MMTIKSQIRDKTFGSLSMKLLIFRVDVSSKKKFVTQSRTGLQIYEGHDDQLNRPGPMA
jgi:hypothetical protein